MLQRCAGHTCPQAAYVPWAEQTGFQWSEQHTQPVDGAECVASNEIRDSYRARQGEEGVSQF